jgi:transposase-like protein
MSMLKSHPHPPGLLGFEEVKRLNMVDFLSRHYGLAFSNGGVFASAHSGSGGQGQGKGQFCCLSPFKEEGNPSFFVREVDGHWLFKDFSSGHGGSLIDFVLIKEGFGNVREALSYIEHVLLVEPGGGVGKRQPSFQLPSSSPTSPTSSTSSTSSTSMPSIDKDKTYEVDSLYRTFRRNDVRPCREYLLHRSINPELVDHLCRDELMVHNRYEGVSYCCFAVFNPQRKLCCLDNHQIGGDGKFVLGDKHPFSLDWSQFPSSKRVFVTESIIDYLSIKTLEGFDFPGIALLGNVINFNNELFGDTREIVSALDGDSGGFRAFLDLEEEFNHKVIRIYDFGDSKDANEYLQKLKERQKNKRLNAEDKLSLYRDFQRSKNKSQVASRWNIDRTYMYEIVKECEDFILSGFSQRRVGRKPSGQPETLDEACKRVKELEAENRRLDEERERYWVSNEFMKLRLKWAEQEAEELNDELEFHGDNQSSSSSSSSSAARKNRKKHLKKKRRKKS